MRRLGYTAGLFLFLLGGYGLFSYSEIVDWLYIEAGKMRGNFTACAMLKHQPPDQVEAARKEFGLRCDS
jgi:uncharacterized protein YegJ (DUF2314 family)